MSDIIKTLLIILKRKKYLLIALIAASLMGIFSYYLMVAKVFNKSILIYAEMNGTAFTIISLVLLLFTALLFGIYIALVVFRREVIKARAAGNKIAGIGGITAGLLATGCPTCGAPILGLISSPLALLSLPFRGIELKIISAFLLSLSIFLVIKNINNNLKCVVTNN